MSDDSVKQTDNNSMKHSHVAKNSIDGPLLTGSQELAMPYYTSDDGIGVLRTGKTRPKTRD